jgi:hypothetical protein
MTHLLITISAENNEVLVKASGILYSWLEIIKIKEANIAGI